VCCHGDPLQGVLCGPLQLLLKGLLYKLALQAHSLRNEVWYPGIVFFRDVVCYNELPEVHGSTL
jgi:hypothetical protein